MSQCDVCIGGFDGEYSEFSHTAIVSARKEHECSECAMTIGKGERHEKVTGKFEGDFFTVRTCLFCAEVRDVFSCGESYALGGQLWEDMRGIAFPKLTTASPCFANLKPSSKLRLLNIWAEWKGLRNDDAIKIR